jgi:signal transduction histidine kinase
VEWNLFLERAQQLALRLENIQLLHRLACEAAEREALARLGELAGSGATAYWVFRAFAREIKPLVDYQRLDIFLTDQDRDQIKCVFQTGKAGWGIRAGEAGGLSGTICGQVVSSRRGRIVIDLPKHAWPDLPRRVMPRAAVVVPVIYADEVLGAVALQNRRPDAYGPRDLDLLLRAGAMLGAALAATGPGVRQIQEPEASAAAQGMAEVLASTQRLEELFEGFAAGVLKLVKADYVNLSWIDINGCDIHTLRAGPGPGISGATRRKGAFATIHTGLLFRQRVIGSLTLWRGRGKTFASREQEVLDWVGVQVSLAVQNVRLYSQAQRQAYQLRQLHRSQGFPASTLDPDAVAQSLVDRAAQMTGANLAALYRYRHETICAVQSAQGQPGRGGHLDPLSPSLLAMAGHCFTSASRRVTGQVLEHAAPEIRDMKEAGDAFCCLLLPLAASTGPIGVLVLCREGESTWTVAEAQLLRHIAEEACETIYTFSLSQDPRRMGSRASLDPLRQELLADASHALRTQLSAIKGYSSTLLQPDISWPPELYREFLETIEVEADRLDRAIGDLLEVTVSEVGAVQLQYSATTVQRLFQGAETEVAGENPGRAVRFDCEPALPPVLVDGARLAQVIGYLLRCADQRAAPWQTLVVRGYLEEGRVVVSIGPTGGDPAGEAPPRAAAQAPASPGYEGFATRWVDENLMLSVCHNLLQAHGAALRREGAESPAGHFRFDLPAAPAPGQGAVAAP